jgi:general stress protein 26
MDATMADKTITDIAADMRDIDFAMLFTRTQDGTLAGRPMSNNRDVDFDGDSHFFSYDTARTIADIKRDPGVALSMQGKSGIFGKPPLFISIQGNAALIRDKAAFASHWSKDLDRWFVQGIDTPGAIMIKVHATRIHYWDGTEEADLIP